MRVDIKTHISNCKTCFENNPVKTEANHPGLTMDWLCCNLCEIRDKKGKKQDFLVIVNRYSSFVRAYKLGLTKMKNVIRSLEEFIEGYYGIPLLLMIDGGPQFGNQEMGVRSWNQP